MIELSFDDEVVVWIEVEEIDIGSMYGVVTRWVSSYETPASRFRRFCVSWHERLDRGEAVEASDFDRFRGDMLDAGRWSFYGRRCLDAPPAFLPDDEVSVRVGFVEAP